MEIHEKNVRAIDLIPRIFTYDQLSRISNDNFEVLNRNVNILTYDADDLFVLYPETHLFYLFENEVTPLIRTAVSKLNKIQTLGFQDLTYGQWDEGDEIE